MSKQHSLHWKSDGRGEEGEKWYEGGVGEAEEAGRIRDWGGGGEDWE